MRMCDVCVYAGVHACVHARIYVSVHMYVCARM